MRELARLSTCQRRNCISQWCEWRADRLNAPQLALFLYVLLIVVEGFENGLVQMLRPSSTMRSGGSSSGCGLDDDPAARRRDQCRLLPSGVMGSHHHPHWGIQKRHRRDAWIQTEFADARPASATQAGTCASMVSVPSP